MADVNAEIPPMINNLRENRGVAPSRATPVRRTGPGLLVGGLPGLWAGYLPGSPRSAKSFASEGVERLLSMALRFLPMFECRRTRRFQVLRVFEAIAGAF